MSQPDGAPKDDQKAVLRTQVIIAAISALSGIVVAVIGGYVALKAADKQIVPVASASQTATASTPAPPTATVTVTVTASAPVNPTDNPAPEGDAIPINWETTLFEVNDDSAGEIGQKMRFSCPSRGIAQEVYGSGLYESQSSICTAAVHDGRLTLKAGGEVALEVRESADKYPGVRRNGITSEETDSGAGSFEFLPAR